MDVQATPPPYTPVGGSHMISGNPPVLGSQIPGSTGGLPALSGLSAAQNPMAEQLQSMGRGDDTMLVHMTPNEVNSLQGLAMAAGGSLTINPQTGLPEAGFLKKLLPMIAGIGLNFLIPGLGLGIKGLSTAAQAGLMTGAASTAITGDLQKGLMAGLGAFGGASLAGGVEGAISGAAKAGAAAPPAAVPEGVLKSFTNLQAPTGGIMVGGVPTVGTATLNKLALGNVAGTGVGAGTGVVKTGLPGFFQGFGNTARGSMTGLAGKAAPMAASMGVLNTLSEATAPNLPKYEEEQVNYVPMQMGKREVRFQTPEQMRASGGAEFLYLTPTNPEPEPIYGPRGYAEGGSVSPHEDNFRGFVDMYNLQNPGPITASMYPLPSPVVPPPAPGMGIAPPRGGEVVYDFNRPQNPQNPQGIVGGLDTLGIGGQYAGQAALARGTQQRQRPDVARQRFSVGMLPIRGARDASMPAEQVFAGGGAVNMRDGSFVVDARTVSELGNGSSNAGIDMLSRMGGRPVRGPGDGVSDSVKASIGGIQEARVARDEVIFPPEAVRRMGGGNEARGTKKLYALMDKAHKARKKAKRGQDTGVRRGLA